MLILEAMAANGVKTLIYSSTCATYGEPEKMPITEVTPQVRMISGYFNGLLILNCDGLVVLD